MADTLHPSVSLLTRTYLSFNRDRQLVVTWIMPDKAPGTRGLTEREFTTIRLNFSKRATWPPLDKTPVDINAHVLVFEIKFSERADAVESLVYGELMDQRIYVLPG